MNKIVLGEGPPHTRVMLVGQNPGKEEARQGRPFVGRSGKFLNELLERYGIDRNALYITSVVKETTPGDRQPTPGKIRHWIPYLMNEIRRVRPDTVVLMGKVAWEVPRLEGIAYIETYHPAAAMRFPRARKGFEEDFARLKQQLNLLPDKDGYLQQQVDE